MTQQFGVGRTSETKSLLHKQRAKKKKKRQTYTQIKKCTEQKRNPFTSGYEVKTL